LVLQYVIEDTILNKLECMTFMKTLLLLRHANASLTNNPTLSDYKRPLTYQGKRDAHIIGKFLKKKKLIPDMIVSSTALRAVETTKLIAKDINYKNEIDLSELLYQTNVKDYINVISKISDENNVVLLVGHNPILEDLVEIITNELKIIKTCSLVHIALPVNSWIELETKIKGKLIEQFDISSL
jgi:phosphohistidine phosphatase